jgi:Rrf2 family transcriptional repressor of oqxAB
VTADNKCLVTNHSAEAAVLGVSAGRTLADSLDELRAVDRAGSAPASGTPDRQPA